MAEERGNTGVEPGAQGIKLDPVAAIVAPGGEPTDATTVLYGYVGEIGATSIRLWLDRSFTRYADVLIRDIVANQTLEYADTKTYNDTKTYLWIRRSARVNFVRMYDVEAGFLSDDVTGAYLNGLRQTGPPSDQSCTCRCRSAERPILEARGDWCSEHRWWPPCW